MHECRRTQRGFARIASIEKRGLIASDRHAVDASQFHEEVVRMLTIDKRIDTIRCLARLKQERIAALAHERIEREHRAQSQRPGPKILLTHGHEHTLAERLVSATRATL